MSDRSDDQGAVVVRERRVGNGAGFASIISGILGVFFLGLLFVPLGLIFGIVALAKKQFALGILGIVCCLFAALPVSAWSPT